MAKSNAELFGSKSVGKIEVETEQLRPPSLTQVDSSTSNMLNESTWGDSQICNHGYFPKEIVRYLVARLRDGGIPSEAGYDGDLATSQDRLVEGLRQKFRDSRPFYFLAFPLQHRIKVGQILSETGYPLVEDEELDKLSLTVQKKVTSDSKPLLFWRISSIVAVLGISAGVIYAFLWAVGFLFE